MRYRQWWCISQRKGKIVGELTFFSFPALTFYLFLPALEEILSVLD
jgi:hypothetical protein